MSWFVSFVVSFLVACWGGLSRATSLPGEATVFLQPYWHLHAKEGGDGKHQDAETDEQGHQVDDGDRVGAVGGEPRGVEVFNDAHADGQGDRQEYDEADDRSDYGREGADAGEFRHGWIHSNCV